MPTEKVINRDFNEIFKASVRYEIPFFQRGYAWEQRQWKKLFEDLQSEIIENVENNKFSEQEHFFGPIVVLEKKFDHPAIKKFLVIDGQQRITTSYLLLGVIKRLLEDKAHLSTDAQQYVSELEKLLVNDVSTDDDYLKLKVFSTKGDRLPTYKSIFKENPNTSLLTEDQLLYDPTTNKVDEFVKFATKKLSKQEVPSLYHYYQAIIKSLKIVWIPLDEEKDDAQAIFESLNDAGMPLTASELLCNYIFRPLSNDATNQHEKLHNEKWLEARKKVGENNFEEYLRTLFSIGEKKRVGKERRMYVHYKIKNKKLTSELAKSTLEDILGYTTAYNHIISPIQKPHPDAIVKDLLIKIFNTNMSSINPFLLSLLKANENESLTIEEVRAILQETYVLLVRRKITKLSVTKYDTFFPSLLKQIIHEPNKVLAFHKKVQDEQLWISDQEFVNALLEKEIYNQRELNFSRLVLQEIDKKMQPFGELPDYTTIHTIEHVLPQTLNAHWKDYLGTDAQEINLPTITNTLGNLSLNGTVANSTFGQKPFEEKKTLYTDSSALAKHIKGIEGFWSIEAIKNRSKNLSEHALKVWQWTL